jgi:quercetin dioxygenase-like cupin family protein
MNDRRTFLTAGLGSGLLLSAASVLGQDEPEPKLTQPKVVAAGEGTSVWALGIRVTVKVQSVDTAGAYSIFEDLIPPNAGPPPHTHAREDETIFVLEGKLRAWLGGQQYDVKPGDFVHMPRGVEHYFKNITTEPTRLLLSYTPGGFEQWFFEVGKPVVAGDNEPPRVTADDIQKAIRAAEAYGVEFHKR